MYLQRETTGPSYSPAPHDFYPGNKTSGSFHTVKSHSIAAKLWVSKQGGVLVGGSPTRFPPQGRGLLGRIKSRLGRGDPETGANARRRGRALRCRGDEAFSQAGPLSPASAPFQWAQKSSEEYLHCVCVRACGGTRRRVGVSRGNRKRKPLRAFHHR